MKKNVLLKIKSSQYTENLAPSGGAFRRELELEDTVEILTEGTMYTKDNATYITYEESAEAGLEDVRTMLKLTDKSLRIRRYGKGDDDTDMLLQQGVRNITRYKLPQLASIDLEIYTNRLNGEFNEEGYGNIEVDYKIRFDQFFSRRNVLEIEIQPS